MLLPCLLHRKELLTYLHNFVQVTYYERVDYVQLFKYETKTLLRVTTLL